MEALKTLVLLVFLLFALREHKKISMKNYKDKLFDLRHELFMIPLNHKIEYDDKIYRHYERIVNNQIRFAHKLSFSTIYLLYRKLKKRKVELEDKEDIILEGYPAEMKNEFLKIRNEMTKITISYLSKTSPVFWFVVFLEVFKTIKVVNEDINVNVSFKKINNCINVMASETKFKKVN